MTPTSSSVEWEISRVHGPVADYESRAYVCTYPPPRAKMAHPRAHTNLPHAQGGGSDAIAPLSHEDDEQLVYARIVQDMHALPPVSVVAYRLEKLSRHDEHSSSAYAEALRVIERISPQIAHMLDVHALLHTPFSDALRARWPRNEVVRKLDSVSALAAGGNDPGAVCDEWHRRIAQRQRARRAYRQSLRGRNRDRIAVGKSIPFWLPYRNSFADEHTEWKRRYEGVHARVRAALEAHGESAVYQYISKRNVARTSAAALESNLRCIDAWCREKKITGNTINNTPS